MLVRSFANFAFIAAVVGGISAASAQELLAWRFTPGESLNYVVQQNMTMTMDVKGKQQTVEMNQTMDMQWKIADVDAASGDVNMAQTVERMRMTSEGGPIGSITYDSSSDADPGTPYGRALADVFRKLIRQEFGVHMKSTGKIDEVTVPEALVSSLKQSGTTGNALDEATLKQLMTQSAITLPEKPVQQNDSWDSVQQVEMPFGTVSVKSRLTYQGTDPGTGFAKIAMVPSITVTPKQGATVDLSLTKTEGTGTLLFDAARGRIAKSDLNLTMQMKMTSFGQVIDQTIQQKTSMTLAR